MGCERTREKIACMENAVFTLLSILLLISFAILLVICVCCFLIYRIYQTVQQKISEWDAVNKNEKTPTQRSDYEREFSSHQNITSGDTKTTERSGRELDESLREKDLSHKLSKVPRPAVSFGEEDT